MTKYIIVGDTHGDVPFVSQVTRAAKELGIETILQVGDFGVWDHKPDGVYFLDKLNENSELRGVKWYFVPGNHENYDRLENYEAYADEHGTRTPEGFVPLRDNIFYVGKTNVWTWDGVLFAAAGGAYSIDKAWRTPGVSWWPQETLTPGEVVRLHALMSIAGRHADVLLTHDSSTSLPEWPGFLKDDPDSQAHREIMDQVWDITRPTWWFHGHYHRYLQYRHHDTYVTGVNCNPYDGPRKANWLVFDTADGSFDVTPWHGKHSETSRLK